MDVRWNPESFPQFLRDVFHHATAQGVARQNPLDVLDTTNIWGYLTFAAIALTWIALALTYTLSKRRLPALPIILAGVAVVLIAPTVYVDYARAWNIHQVLGPSRLPPPELIAPECNKVLWLPFAALSSFAILLGLYLVRALARPRSS